MRLNPKWRLGDHNERNQRPSAPNSQNPIQVVWGHDVGFFPPAGVREVMVIVWVESGLKCKPIREAEP